MKWLNFKTIPDQCNFSGTGERTGPVYIYMYKIAKCSKSCNIQIIILKRNMYRNDPKFSDRQAWADSADPDQTAPRV